MHSPARQFPRCDEWPLVWISARRAFPTCDVQRATCNVQRTLAPLALWHLALWHLGTLAPWHSWHSGTLGTLAPWPPRCHTISPCTPFPVPRSWFWPSLRSLPGAVRRRARRHRRRHRTTRPSLLLRTSTSRTCIDASRRRRPTSGSTSTTISSRTTRAQAVDGGGRGGARRSATGSVAIDAAIADARQSARSRAAAARHRLALADARGRPPVGAAIADTYSSGLTNTAYIMIKREFAPPDERLRKLIAREKAMPAALAEARKNLDNPPRIYTADRDRTTRRQPRVLPDGGSGSVHEGDRQGAARGVQGRQRRRHRRARRLQEVAAERSAEAIERRVRVRRRHLPEEARGGRNDRACRSTSCWRLPNGICGRTRRRLPRPRRRIDPKRTPAAGAGRRSRPITRRRPSCCRRRRRSWTRSAAS